MKKMLEKLKKIRNLKPRQMLKLATAQMRLLNLADLWYFMETKPFHTRLQLMNFYSTLFPQVNTDTTYSVYINYLNGKRLKEIHGALKTNETKYIELADVLEGTGCSEGTLYWVISPPLTVRKEAWKLGIRQFHDRGYISYHSDKGGYSVIHGISSYVQHGKNARRLKKVYSRLDQEPFVTGVMID
ncbi:hypothetical protein HY488_03015, partial [Candidatus Woesearchaeota archaeon]|nr:hypothetical protein [Candidatus Woesearchaeota archaeon]